MCLVCCQNVQRPVLDLFQVFKRVIAFIFFLRQKDFLLVLPVMLCFSFLFFFYPICVLSISTLKRNAQVDGFVMERYFEKFV